MQRVAKIKPIVLFLIYLLSFSTLGWAESSSQKNKETLSPPTDILTLDVSWWQYFQAQNAQTRQKSLSHLQSLIEQVPEPLRGELYTNTEKVLALYTKVLNTDVKPENPWLTENNKDKSKTYTLKEVLAIMQVSDDLKQTRSQQQQQIERLVSTIKEGKDTLQSLKNSYLENDTLAEPAKIYRLGLQWVRDRLQIAIAEHQLSLLHQKNKQLDEWIKIGESVENQTQTRLNVPPKERDSFVNEHKTLKEKLDKQRKTLAEERLRFIDYEGDIQAVRDREAQQQFKILALEVAVALKEIKLRNVDLSKEFAALLEQAPEQANTTTLRRSMNTADDLSDIWKKRLLELRNQTHAERTKASNRLLALASAGDAEKTLVDLNTTRVQQTDELLSELQQVQFTIMQQARLLKLIQQKLKAYEGVLTTVITSSQISLEEQWQMAVSYLYEPLFEINETPITTLGILRFFFILFVAWVISRLIRMALRRVAKARADHNNIAFVLSKILHYIILVFAFLVGLSSLNIDITRFALLASALSIGIGFGLQNVVSNFVSGIILLFERSIKVGDFIEFESGVRGQVKEMNIRSTLISTNDNIDIVVPNADFVNGHVTNWTMREAVRRVRINFGVAYDSNRRQVRDVVLEAALKIPHTLTVGAPEPQVRMTGFGDNSLDFQLLVWIKGDIVKRPGRMEGIYLWAVADALEEHDIEIPFPQRDVHIRSGVLPIQTVSTDTKSEEVKAQT